MEFELTPELTDEIIFAMEDQTGRFLFDSADGRCVAERDRPDYAEKSVFDDANDRYYSIPVWDSVSGFRMMDRFTAQLRNPVAREDLRVALASGHGVFRSFKNILKGYPEIERMWYLFKEREMRDIVLEWYNGLRDFWGLERIGSEPEETDEIVAQDFLFREAVAADEAFLASIQSDVVSEIAESLPGDLADAIAALSACVAPDVAVGGGFVLAVESMEGDVVAFASSSAYPISSARVARLSSIAVRPDFRGMGIGKELLGRTVAHWAKRGYRWLVFAAPVVPPSFLPALHRAGFLQKGHVSVLDLSGAACH